MLTPPVGRRRVELRRDFDARSSKTSADCLAAKGPAGPNRPVPGCFARKSWADAETFWRRRASIMVIPGGTHANLASQHEVRRLRSCQHRWSALLRKLWRLDAGGARE